MTLTAVNLTQIWPAIDAGVQYMCGDPSIPEQNLEAGRDDLVRMKTLRERQERHHESAESPPSPCDSWLVFTKDNIIVQQRKAQSSLLGTLASDRQ